MNITYPFTSAMLEPTTHQEFAEMSVGKLNQLLRSLQPLADEEAIHHFRVQYKKTRALFRMGNAMQQGKVHRLNKSGKKIYELTGYMRDTSILLHLVQPHFGDGILVQYLHQQQTAREFSLQEALKTVKPFSLSDKKWKKFKSPDLAAYFENKLQQSKEGFSAYITDQQLHQIRKYLKDILYNVKSLTLMGIAIPSVILGYGIDRLEALTKLLGKYQDRVVQVTALRQLTEIPALQEEAKNIATLLQEVAHQQTIYRGQIMLELEDFFHLHTAGPLDQ
jgi:CHAD domain-containing protein